MGGSSNLEQEVFQTSPPQKERFAVFKKQEVQKKCLTQKEAFLSLTN